MPDPVLLDLARLDAEENRRWRRSLEEESRQCTLEVCVERALDDPLHVWDAIGELSTRISELHVAEIIRDAARTDAVLRTDLKLALTRILSGWQP